MQPFAKSTRPHDDHDRFGILCLDFAGYFDRASEHFQLRNTTDMSPEIISYASCIGWSLHAMYKINSLCVEVRVERLDEMIPVMRHAVTLR